MRRLAAAVGATGVVLVGGWVGGGGWFYSGQLLPAPISRLLILDRTVVVLRRADGGVRVVLEGDARTRLAVVGVYLADGAFLQLSGSVEEREGHVVRDAAVLRGSPTSGRIPARLDPYAWPDTDPGASGLEFEEVEIPTELGPAPAYRFPGEDATWMIFVHGRSANRNEANRLARITRRLGHPGLSITYRNDGEGPRTDDGVGRYGITEWRDLAAAVDWTLEQGAESVVLAGFSQGASLVAFHLVQRPNAPVVGVILDAPLLDLPATLVQQAKLRAIPGALIAPLLWGTRSIAQARSRFDPATVDHVAAAATWPDVPVLLFHGALDDFVPVGPSDRLAAALGDRVTYVRVPDAGHVESWNADPDSYAAAVQTFLMRVALTPAAG